jgi:hypothetical protein
MMIKRYAQMYGGVRRHPGRWARPPVENPAVIREKLSKIKGLQVSRGPASHTPFMFRDETKDKPIDTSYVASYNQEV